MVVLDGEDELLLDGNGVWDFANSPLLLHGGTDTKLFLAR